MYTGMNRNQLVSILLPVYNVEQYLPLCLDSVINQTYKNLQIVLIDDGSKDGSWAIMQEYAKRDNRIEIYHQENQGVAATRNHLLEKVKGDYVLFVDSDDWIELNMVEFLVEKSRTKDADIVVCGMVKNDEACGEEYREEVMDQETTVKKFLFHKELSGSLWNKLVKTSLLQDIRFDNRISYGEDALFCWYVLQRVHTVVQTDKQLYHYRMNDTSISHQNWTPEKKGSGHLVWTKIVEETSELWPQYLSIATARCAMEDFWAIYFAAINNYPFDKEIVIRQQNVRKGLAYIISHKIDSWTKILSAFVLCRWYGFGAVLKILLR